MKIEIINYVWSKVSRIDADTIAPALKYTRKRIVQGDFAMETLLEEASFVDRRNGRFLTGFLPRIKEYCKINNISVEMEETEHLPKVVVPKLVGIDFRCDQTSLLQQAAIHQRGVIKSPTGTGKTILAAGICAMWPQANILFLCHTIDLLLQSSEAFRSYGLDNILTIGGGRKDPIDWKSKKRVVIVSTRQSWDKMDYVHHRDFFDVIIIDEAHHVRGGQYTKFLEQSLAIGRFGFTATLPETEQDYMTLEGYIGPVIGEFSLTEGIEKQILAKPLIELIPVPYSEIIGNMYTKYKDLYKYAIVESRVRNRLVLLKAMETIDNGGSVLILVSKNTEHGKLLTEMAKDIFDLNVDFIYGKTSKTDRIEAKNQLERKEVKCVIANIVWYEGINIKSVNHVINAAGGKSSITAEQIPGRGLRTTEEKKTLRYTDFLDPYKYLSHHTVMRLNVYANLGWLKWE